MRWIYAKLGELMWEWETGQSVMFYEADERVRQLPPPMSDADCRRLELSLRSEGEREDKRYREQYGNDRSETQISTRRTRGRAN